MCGNDKHLIQGVDYLWERKEKKNEIGEEYPVDFTDSVTFSLK